MHKILYILNQRMPTEKAYGFQVAKTCEAFTKIGVDLELVVPYRRNSIEIDFTDHYDLDTNFKLKIIYSPDFYWPGILDKLAFTIKQFLSAIRLSIYALKKKPDLIYSRDEWPLFILGFFRDNLYYEAHKFSKKRSFFYNRFKRKKMKIIVITDALKRFFIEEGFDEENILVARDGVDLKKFNLDLTKEEARERTNLPNDRKVVMYTGHLFEWKGAHILARVVSMLPNCLFVFVGGTKAEENKFRDEFGRIKNILITGQKSHALIPYYLKSADILVLPNSGREAISRFFTSPLKLFEYMASQRVIVASALPSIKEILNENNSILVEPDSPESLANGIVKALEGKDNQKLIKKAYQDVLAYSWLSRSKEILSFIES